MVDISNELSTIINNPAKGDDLQKAIYDGIKNTNENVEKTTVKQTELENTLETLTIDGGVSDQEIIDAREDSKGKTHTDLKKRIDSIGSDIESNQEIIDARKNSLGIITSTGTYSYPNLSDRLFYLDKLVSTGVSATNLFTNTMDFEGWTIANTGFYELVTDDLPISNTIAKTLKFNQSSTSQPVFIYQSFRSGDVWENGISYSISCFAKANKDMSDQTNGYFRINWRGAANASVVQTKQVFLTTEWQSINLTITGAGLSGNVWFTTINVPDDITIFLSSPIVARSKYVAPWGLAPEDINKIFTQLENRVTALEGDVKNG